MVEIIRDPSAKSRPVLVGGERSDLKTFPADRKAQPAPAATAPAAAPARGKSLREAAPGPLSGPAAPPADAKRPRGGGKGPEAGGGDKAAPVVAVKRRAKKAPPGPESVSEAGAAAPAGSAQSLGGATEAAPGAAKTGSPLAAAPGASCRPGRGAAPYAGRFGDGSDGGGKAKPRKTPAGNKKKKAKEGLGPDAIKAMPKRARRILTLRNPELLEKAAECALRRPEAPADAAAPRKSAADDKKGPKKARLSRKNRRILNKYGLVANIYGERVSTKKLLSYRMLFTDPPIESMTDEEAAKNIRLLFLAFADHKFPEKYDKFVVFLRNNMCRGISEEQLERLLKILKGNSYITVKKDESVSVNIGLSAAAFAAKPHSSPKKK